jgi:hypothetical protein
MIKKIINYLKGLLHMTDTQNFADIEKTQTVEIAELTKQVAALAGAVDVLVKTPLALDLSPLSSKLDAILAQLTPTATSTAETATAATGAEASASPESTASSTDAA